jgi:tRNA pseudouridine65 synthase
VTTPLPILHLCDRFVAIDKPAGMVVHRHGQHDDGAPAVLQTLRDQIGAHLYPVHRLDRGASGVLVFALDPGSARALADRFAAHAVDKRYLVIVRGWLDGSGEIDSPLDDDEGGPLQPASTRWFARTRVELARACGRYASARYTLVEARPRTGRLHQLRRHFAHVRHPVVGDVRHGDGAHNRLWRALAQPGLMLRAIALSCELDDRRLDLAVEPRLDAVLDAAVRTTAAVS